MLGRSDKKTVTKAVNVSKLLEAKNLTLTKSPANEVAFKVVRKDDKGNTVPANKISRQRPVRRMAPTLTLLVPDTVDEAGITSLMENFGISDYKVGEPVEGKRAIQASDAKDMPKNYVTVNLKDGVQALIEQGEVLASDENPVPNISVIEINFKKTNFASDVEVKAWAEENGIDISESEIDNGDELVTVRRSKVEDGTETKTVTVGDGVEAVIARSECCNIPQTMFEVVSETAYGQWGWGQLDFAAYMADVEFSGVAREALDVLDTVIREILFWSPLPVSVRKELVARASAQFAEFIGGLLDALPNKVVINYRSDKEMTDMTTKSKAAEALASEQAAKQAEIKKRADGERKYLAEQGYGDEAAIKALSDADACTTADELRKRLDAEEKAKAENAPIARKDVEAMVANAVTAGVAAALEAAGVKRTDTPEAKAEADRVAREAAEKKTAEQVATTVAAAVRSAMEPVAKTLTDMGDKLEKVASQTVVRSDGQDGKQTTDKPDVFAGMFKTGGKSA